MQTQMSIIHIVKLIVDIMLLLITSRDYFVRLGCVGNMFIKYKKST